MKNREVVFGGVICWLGLQTFTVGAYTLKSTFKPGSDGANR